MCGYADGWICGYVARRYTAMGHVTLWCAATSGLLFHILCPRIG